MKKYGGTLKNWKIHNLDFTKEQIETVYPGCGALPKVITAEVVEDARGGWIPGDTMRSSLITHLDRNYRKLETMNTFYDLEGPESDDPDLGNIVLTMFF